MLFGCWNRSNNERVSAMAKARPKTSSTKAPTKEGSAKGTIAHSRGAGGELHQIAGGETDTLTTQHGIPVADDQNSLRQGARGPTLLEDAHFREKIFHFDHERIPERVVHARGFGAHGYFEPYEPLTDLTSADLFQRPGERTASSPPTALRRP